MAMCSSKADDTSKYKWEEAPELHNENWDYYNYSKNKLLLESLCVNTDVRLFQLNVFDIDHSLMNSYGSDNQSEKNGIYM